VAATTSSFKGGWLRIFDRELRLLDRRKLPQAACYCAVNRPQPLVLLSFAGTGGWQLIRQQGNSFQPISSGVYGARRQLLAAAISPDGKLLVTGHVSERPTIFVWNPANGTLVGELRLEGGIAKFDLPSHHTIVRLAFSPSGRYLTAADLGNAYLLEAT
jgi:WD40 repeat protein